MPTSITAVGGPGTDWPNQLERFTEPDTNDGVACVPLSNNMSNPQILPLLGADMLSELDVCFRFRGQLNAFSGALTLSPWYPGILVQNLTIPYQSGSLRLATDDGDMLRTQQRLRTSNQPYMSKDYMSSAFTQDDVTPMTLLNTYPTAAPIAGATVSINFNIKLIAAEHCEYWYDADSKGNMLQYENAFVSPFLMSSTGRNSQPSISLNPVFGPVGDKALFVPTGAQTTPATWTDLGSLVYIRRQGWRQPVNAALMPPLFNWARQIYSTEFLLGSSRATIALPTEGQLVCIVARLFDPTLNSGAGGPIPIGNLQNMSVVYGSGVVKVNETPFAYQDRMWRQYGWLPKEGYYIVDLFRDTQSNRDRINTYDTASPRLIFDFGQNTPGPGAYVDVGLTYYTLVTN